MVRADLDTRSLTEAMRYPLSHVALAVYFIFQGAAAYAAETPATAVVEALHASLIDTMKEGGGRRQPIEFPN